MTPTTTATTITEIPLEQLHESPFNQRQRFAVDDLAASIRSEGRVLEPLLVRPRIFAQGLARRADGQRDDDDTQDGFEIVFGHRRLRAVKYRCPATGSTWSGRGLQPAWVKAALANGRSLADLQAAPAAAKMPIDARREVVEAEEAEA